MGSEAKCIVELGKRSSSGRAYLETDELVFRGDFSLKIPYQTIISVAVVDGSMKVRFAKGAAVFHLGEQAEKWASKILNPKGLLDKLGVKAEHKVTVVGLEDPGFISELEGRVADVVVGRPRKSSDVIFFGADSARDLRRLATLRKHIKPDGAIWVIRSKGPGANIKEIDIIRTAKDQGLVDVKVARFSETHSALKVVIPVAQRQRPRVRGRSRS